MKSNIFQLKLRLQVLVILSGVTSQLKEIKTSHLPLCVQDVLLKLRHHNGNQRREGLQGLRELIPEADAAFLSVNLGTIITSLAKLTLDPEKDVRHDNFKTLRLVLEKVCFMSLFEQILHSQYFLNPWFSISGPRRVRTFFWNPEFLPGLCHDPHPDFHSRRFSASDRYSFGSYSIFDGQISSACFTLLPRYDFSTEVSLIFTVLKKSLWKILSVFLTLKKIFRGEQKPDRLLSVNLSGKLSAVQWRLQVLQRLQRLLTAMVDSYKNSISIENDSAGKPGQDSLLSVHTRLKRRVSFLWCPFHW